MPATIVIPLDGDQWTLSRADGSDPVPATVPGCNFTDLHRAGRIPDPFVGTNEAGLHWIDDTAWTYAREVDIPAELLAHEQVELVCDGLDTVAEIVIGDLVVGHADNMHRSWRFPSKHALHHGRNRIQVRFADPTAYAMARTTAHRIDDGAAFLGSLIRKQHSSFSWDWAPSLAPTGIHRGIRLEGRSTPRIAWCRIEQVHAGGSVTVRVTPETTDAGGALRHRLDLDGVVVAYAEGPMAELAVARPRLWWPNGHGAQPLYRLTVELMVDGKVTDTWTRSIGLRTVELRRPKDAWGEGFLFAVNGREIYAMGANWVPPHQFASEVRCATYDRLVNDAADAGMNMLRVWGGGLYEQESFYDACDRRGLLVWQDFCFSCSLYPDDEAFRANVRAEAAEVARRLAHRACLTLFCGNNEIEHFGEHLEQSPPRAAAYERLFGQVLPAEVERWAPATPYWMGSPHHPDGWRKGANREDGGDGHHYWEPWAHRPKGIGTDRLFRFCSEFGLQAFPSMASIATFAADNERNYFHPVIEAHQKRNGFNTLLLKMAGERYRMGRDFAAQAHLTQLNQAHLLATAIEHHRRHRGRCMGSLYWQLNDTWPGITWSTIDFTGRWKAGHHAVRRAFSPVLLSLTAEVREERHLHSRMTRHDHAAHLHLTCDDPAGCDERILWEVRDLEGRVLAEGLALRALPFGGCERVATVPLADLVANHGEERLLVRAWLAGRAGSERTLLLAEPQRIELAKAHISVQVESAGPGRATIILASDHYHHAVWLTLPDSDLRLSDNGMDLHAGVPLRLEAVWDGTPTQLRHSLTITDLRSTY